MDLTWHAYFTLGAIIVMIIALVRGIGRTDLVLLGTLGALLLAGVVTPDEAFQGFSNPAVIAIASLFVVAAGIERTGALGFLDRLLEPRSSNPTTALLRLMLPTALLSGILNNTPIVAVLIPRVQTWARTAGIPASKLLMPLSTAAMVGGWLTLIGTSTNVVVHGLLLSEGLPGFNFFDLTWVGVPAVILVSAYYAFIGNKLLPDRGDATMSGRVRDYQFELTVLADAPFIGRTVEEANLRTLGGAYLAHVRRSDSVMEIQPETTLLPDDVLRFVGDVQAHDMLSQRPGLARKAPHVDEGRPDLPLVEAVVAPSSSLVGMTLKEIGFRETYGGVVLGIQRHDSLVDGGLGGVAIQPGDLLLIEGRPTLARRLSEGSNDFALVSPHDYVRPVARRAPLSLAILFATILLVATGLLPLVTAAFAGAIGMIVTGCLRGQAIGKAIDVPVIFVIAAALGLGKAVESTGLAAAAAHGIVSVAGSVGPVTMLVIVYVCANLLAELITNKASAVLMLPVALAVAAELGADWKAFAVAVTVASAASFLTPIGYQTNLMVMGPGGYTYTDYSKAGFPVSLIVLLTTVITCALVWL